MLMPDTSIDGSFFRRGMELGMGNRNRAAPGLPKLANVADCGGCADFASIRGGGLSCPHKGR